MAHRKRNRHWMQKAFGKHPGRFSAKARRAGKSTQEYAREEKNAPGALGKEARLAALGKRLAKRRHHRGHSRGGRR